MYTANEIARRSLPEETTGLFLRPGSNGFKVLVMVTRETSVHLELPKVFNVRTEEGEELKSLGEVPIVGVGIVKAGAC